MKTPKRSLFVFLALLVVSLLAFNAHAARKKNSAARETVRQNAPHPPITIASAAPNCTLPGVTVVSDPTGDENTMVGSSKQDIQSVSIAELGTDTNKLTFTMKVADLSGTLPPNATWRIYFTGANSTLYWVSMLTDATSTVTFTYGTRSGSLDSGVGAADAGDFAADGTIHIKIANSKVGNPTAGQTLTAIFARTYTLVGAAGSGLLVTIDDETNQTGTKQYTLIGNTACAAATPTPTPTPTATATPTPTPTPTPAPVGAAGPPRFFNYVSPQGIADSVGEPSIGSNWKTENTPYGTTAKFGNKFITGADNPIPNGGTTLFFGGFSPSLVRIIFDDCSSPAGTFWQPKALLTANSPRGFGDPILFTDHPSAAELAAGVPPFGRTFVSQLEGLTPAGSTTDITDDDGNTFTPSEGSNLPSCIDHQTIGAGPFHSPLTGTDPVYPHAVYYASQCVSDATAGLSIDGGRTFPTQSVMFTVAQCDGLHGHIKVAPDGTVYVPDKGCGGPPPPLLGTGLASVVFSETNAVTSPWTISTVGTGAAAQTKGDDDPSVGIATDGTIYLGWQSADGHPRIAVGHKTGTPPSTTITWSTPVDVGAPSANVTVVNSGPILNTTFPEVVAGDPNRAAFAFFGSENGSSDYDQPTFGGAWYLYIATTFDGGVTWRTENVTPGDPVQRGGICGSGNCRNQLDFFDATIDKEGRILVGWDDGCVSATCVSGGANDFTAKGVITRQSGGKRMFAGFDPAEPTLPGAPEVSAGVDSPPTAVQLSWPVPDNGGSPITGYNVYRRDANTNTFVLIATVPLPNYTDTTFNPASIQPYRVTAVNGQGESPYCNDITPTAQLLQSPCKLPGVLVDNDLNPDGSDNDAAIGPGHPPDPRVNIRQLFIAEPFLGAGVNKLIFTMQLAPSTMFTTPPPNSQWYIVWQRQFPDPDFDRYYVAMKADASGNLSYEYGKFGVPLDATNPNPNANVPVKLGDADSGSYNVTTGVVTITLSNSKAENVGAGGSLSRVNVRTYLTRPDNGPKTQSTADDITGDGNYTLAGNASCASAVPLLDVVSRKTHGGAGDFDIHLPLSGGPGIEGRTGGTNNAHTVIFTFANPLVSVGGASVTSGTGSVGSSTIGSDPHQYIVNLTGVSNAQRITITLTAITDTAGNSTASLPVTMGVLLGDTTANGVVNSSDIAQTQSQSGQPVTADNFREDVTVNGVINSSDITTVQSKSGTGLP